jgi:DNA polymerase-3 subunit epsilon/exodeoxyribonuclease X
MDLFDFDFGSEDRSNESKIIFFDTETTGANSDDEIIEVGAIVEDLDGNILEHYDELCSAKKLIHPEAMATHGIRNEDIEGKPNFIDSNFWARIQELNSSNSYLVAHNLPFDLGKLEFYGFRANIKLIDTLQCAKHLFELGERLGEYEYELPNYKLQTFRYILFSKRDEEIEANRFNIELKAHSALSDVVILKMFFNELAKRVEGANKEEILENLVELTKKPVLIKQFNFGKYKGKKIEDVLSIDRGYLEWLYNDMKKKKSANESVDENIFGTLKHYLEI